jgi:hypothetical protein
MFARCLQMLFANNVVSFAINLVLIPPLFAIIVVSNLPCLLGEAILFAVRYT